jgi:hypothetical protein
MWEAPFSFCRSLLARIGKRTGLMDLQFIVARKVHHEVERHSFDIAQALIHDHALDPIDRGRPAIRRVPDERIASGTDTPGPVARHHPAQAFCPVTRTEGPAEQSHTVDEELARCCWIGLGIQVGAPGKRPIARPRREDAKSRAPLGGGAHCIVDETIARLLASASRPKRTCVRTDRRARRLSGNPACVREAFRA